MASGKLSSQHKLAGALGVSQSTVAGWLKRDDWPVRRRGPWSGKDLERIRAWRAELQEDRSGKGSAPDAAAGNGGGGDESPAAGAVSGGGSGGASGGGGSKRQQIDTLYKYQRYRKTKIEADEREGKLVERAIVDQALASLAGLFVQVLEDMQESLPHRLTGDRKQNEQVLRDAFDDARRRLSEHERLELDQVADRIQAKQEGKPAARGRKGQQ